ncbi:MAG: DNA-protecting protein DprA [Aquificaceae bacterium]|nr:DNA-protecting protein DprA [Aquificaceae bacterium]MCX8059812.1 DNA-protecting protein DprA [Aquificaceae bacterium]MDW8096886.1 DNA-processing protein DprA [Aquificaceae bacterium]
MEELYNWLTLKAVKGLGEVSIKRLWLRFGSAKAILCADPSELRSIIGIQRTRALLRRSLSFDPERVIKVVEREGIGWLTPEGELYPSAFRELEDPPTVLFYRGELKAVPMIGVVGTRRPELQSLSFIKALAREAVSRGYGVCSGGAPGCDYQSHVECLLAGGYTVCLLGMGLLKAPPYLQKLVGERGLLMSEFLPETRAEEYTFTKRNRLISGLSEALVVVEAGEKSGALITARHATRQRKPLWVYIGNSSSQRWLGCVKLVNEQGAKVLHSPSALFGEAPTPAGSREPILALLSTPKTFDQLLELLGADPSELNLKLLQLEMEGKIARQGYYYVTL